MYLLKLLGRDPSTLLSIELSKALIDGPEVRKVFVLGQGETNLEDQPVDLSIELHSEERHPFKLYYYQRF